MKLYSENDVLKLEFRQKVIKEIQAAENVDRKRDSLKRYEIYKDKIKKYVVEALATEGLKPSTIAQMSNRAANIAICRKVINKLARTYSGGVSRETSGNSQGQKAQVDDLARLLCFDEKMRKGDRYRELQKNMLFQIVPEGVGDPESGEPMLYKLSMRTLLPWHYDVIEDSRDREIARCVILSDQLKGNRSESYATENAAGIHSNRPLALVDGNGQDEIIADTPVDAGNARVFVWWTSNYHFSTDEAGRILPSGDNPDHVNPIGMLPFVNNAEDQDGQFWAQGGDDLIDGTVLVNKLITDMNFIAYNQGWGQMVISGKNLKNKFEIGPNNAIILEHEAEDPEPKVYNVSASPPLDQWMHMIEQYVALLLTTNNLSPANVSMKLDANNFPSGIGLLIEMSEATDDVSDKQKAYKDIERDIWEIVKRWQNLLLDAGELTPEFAEIGAMPADLEVNIKFNDLKPVITEKEKLETLKMRKDLGINEMVDLIMIDNPGLTREEAEKKLLKIMEEKLKNAKHFAEQQTAATGGEPKPEGDEGDKQPPPPKDKKEDVEGYAV